MTLTRREKIAAIAVLLAPRFACCSEDATEVFLKWAARILDGEAPPYYVDHARLHTIRFER